MCIRDRPGREDELNLTLVRDEVKIETVSSHWEQPGLGYIRISNFDSQTGTSFARQLRLMETGGLHKGLILDLRDNPGGLVEEAVKVAKLIVPEGEITRPVSYTHLDVYKRQVCDLSGGEQQRIGLARAIINRPAMIIADEPTGNLDPDISFEIMHILRMINLRGTTVLVATHDREIVDRLKKRVIHLEQGRLTLDEEKGAYAGAL